MNPKGVDASEGRAGRALRCPKCASERVETHVEPQHFTYGVGDSAKDLVAAVPVRTCGNCDFSFTDEAAERAQHQAICEYLGILTPSAIRGIRVAAGLSRAEFALLTRLGEATVARWERGILIPNAAYDRYLRLVACPDNLARLRNLAGSVRGSTIAAPTQGGSPRFRALSASDQLRREQQSFDLRRVG